ncbi:ATP-binding protein [Streptomyces sp. MMBL 11-3]|uniref:ATP-binding protein n=1 Tax=Streptomyces sp. MMBL 11-3 TaxID=3382639 RepID=UPI0039B5B004
MFTTDSRTCSPADARRLALAYLQTHCPTADIGAIQLVLSELVTNAARHTPAGTWTLELHHDDQALTLHVHDHSTHLPRPRTTSALDGNGGLGLHIIDHLTDHTSTTVTPHGKTTTAHWTLT